ncbi:iron-sulfur cluster assembly scaffold protein [Erythrobacter insulae]|uniref:Iron-sulfur cluster assembly scaffold protein n=1 Tax=Erythrobacter insulae TaxID=2584124 RepID=A0A547P7I3_9SPHN|nr:iron-sulfur cluster assembly scaffold protein [Erythrobacter insulae]
MVETTAAKLYSPALLALSTGLADYPFDDSLQSISEARSRTCGSSIKIGLSRDDAGRISKVGMQVAACAVGQSSAAILAQHITGRSLDDLAAAYAALAGWLSGEGNRPDWPLIEQLTPALPYPGRHDAILLPWRAAVEALSSPLSSS